VAGLKIEDWVKSINGEKISKSSELIEVAGKYKGSKVKMLVNRGGEDYEMQVEVRAKPPEGEGSMGVAISNMEMEKIKWYEIHRGIGYGFKEAYYWGKIIGGGVVNMIGGLFVGKTPKDVSGPIGMYEATTAIKRNQGILAVIHFFGVVSVNLAVVNILPFPALDGGRILFVIYEMISRKKAKQSLEVMINNIGMWILLTLILVITVGDLKRLFFK
jgi:regulator of sigma E protease